MADAVTISWCPHGLGIQGDGDNITFMPASEQENESLPELADWIDTAHCIYIPLEQTLTRYIQLPLKSTKHLDADMLLQELSDNAGIEPDDWWLTWQIKANQDGVAGLVFGIKKGLKYSLQNTPVWQHTPLLLIDGWQRLNIWLDGHEDKPSVAVVDMDEEGMFFGFYDAGIWKGMRRLNGDSETHAQQMMWSLQSMGFDAESTPVLGRFSADIATHFSQATEATTDNLPHRHIANLSLAKPTNQTKHVLNLRHGKWASKQTSATLQAWYRPALFAVVIVCLWLGSMIGSNMQYEVELEAMQEDITAAFHRGLPEQPVIIDALAQLRQAAGGNTSSNHKNVSKQLYALSQTFINTPWEMQDFSISKRGINLAGKVKDLDTLNSIRTDLAKHLGADVQIADTDLKGDEVSFRMRW